MGQAMQWLFCSLACCHCFLGCHQWSQTAHHGWKDATGIFRRHKGKSRCVSYELMTRAPLLTISCWSQVSFAKKSQGTVSILVLQDDTQCHAANTCALDWKSSYDGIEDGKISGHPTFEWASQATRRPASPPGRFSINEMQI